MDCCGAMMLAALAVAAAVWYVLRILSVLRPGKVGSATDPFREQPPPEQPSADPVDEDSIIKLPYMPKRVPENLDAIVIGSGIGGLCSAGLLARMGRRVLVLEQHDQAGGCCHQFEEQGFEFDTGIHYIGSKMDDPAQSDMRALLDAFTDGKTEWAQMDDEFDCFVLGERRYPFMGRRNPKTGQWRYKEHLMEQFPQEREGIERIFRMVRETKGSMLSMFVVKLLPLPVVRLMGACGLLNRMLAQWTRSTQSVLDECTSNKELQAAVCYSFGDYGVVPSKSPWPMQAVIIRHYMEAGAYYPVGGSSRIARYAVPVIRRPGGEVLCRARVQDIILHNGRAVGVRMAKDGNEILAPLIISDAGFANTYARLLPQPQPLVQQVLSRVEHSCSCMSVYVGFDGTAEQLGLKAQNFWIFNSADLEGDVTRFMSLTREEILSGDFEVPMVFFAIGSAKDPKFEERHPGKSTCELVTLAKWDWFADWETEQVKKRGDDYAQLKRVIADRTWARVLRMLPKLRDHVQYFDVGSPVTNNYYLNAVSGEMYGLDHSLQRFSPEVMPLLRPETPYKGLYITGQDVMTCGFGSALMAGALTVSAITRRNIVLDLVQRMKRQKKSGRQAGQ